MIARECHSKNIECDEFGDLRLYRNAILHLGGRLHRRPSAIKVFKKGDLITPTGDQLREIFASLVLALNELGRKYYRTDPREPLIKSRKLRGVWRA